jgi:ubiquinol-cytochrome c reductase cytochrome b subunit
VIALPLVILLLVVLHLGALHEVGSNNPDGVDIKKVKNESHRQPPTASPSIRTTRSRTCSASASS